MKAVFIAYNQANTERIDYLLDKLEIRGFTQWVDVNGRGTETGNPHLGTHTWHEKNSAVLTIVPDEKVDILLESIKRIDHVNEEVGIRAFVWDVLKSI